MFGLGNVWVIFFVVVKSAPVRPWKFTMNGTSHWHQGVCLHAPMSNHMRTNMPFTMKNRQHGTLALEPFILEVLAGGCVEKRKTFDSCQRWVGKVRVPESFFIARRKVPYFATWVCAVFFQFSNPPPPCPPFLPRFPSHHCCTHAHDIVTHTHTQYRSFVTYNIVTYNFVSHTHTHTMLHAISAHTRPKVECRNL